jgi:apolipoprotein N-acyltransferase
MDRFANTVILSWGWRRRLIALGAGALSAAAMPPLFIFPILWVTFPVLVWLIDGAVARTASGRVQRLAPAFTVGWWFGFGYFVAGLWWVGSAFLVEPEKFGWLLPVAVLALPAGLAIFWGLGAMLAQLLWSEGWQRVFALAVGLGSAEWLRGHVLTGFPWNAIGYALTTGEVLMQSASVFGIYGLSVIAVAIFAAPASLAPATSERRQSAALPVLSIAALSLLGVYGIVRLSTADAGLVPGVTVRVMQPALPQLQKWDPERKDEVLSTYFRLSAPEGAPLAKGTVLVWPESAFPFALTQNPGALAAIAELLPEGTTLVTGAYREEHPSSGPTQVFNTIYVVGPDGTILSAYDKVHLVPFGEFLPARDRLSDLGLSQLTFESFSAGPTRRPLALPLGPSFLPLICYEIIFSGQIGGGGERPDFVLNVTNDGWFGRTTGPYQHFHQARVRAVEEGLPLVRAANTGISAIVDAYGRIVTSAPLGKATMIEAQLPASIEPPIYARWGEMPFLLLLAVALAFSAAKYFYRVALE